MHLHCLHVLFYHTLHYDRALFIHTAVIPRSLHYLFTLQNSTNAATAPGDPTYTAASRFTMLSYLLLEPWSRRRSVVKVHSEQTVRRHRFLSGRWMQRRGRRRMCTGAL